MNYDIELNINAYNNEELKNIISINTNYSLEELSNKINQIILDIEKNNVLSIRKKNKIKSFLKNIENKLTIEFLKNSIALNEITNSLLKNVINTQNRLEEKLNKIMNKLDIVLE